MCRYPDLGLALSSTSITALSRPLWSNDSFLFNQCPYHRGETKLPKRNQRRCFVTTRRQFGGRMRVFCATGGRKAPYRSVGMDLLRCLGGRRRYSGQATEGGIPMSRFPVGGLHVSETQLPNSVVRRVIRYCARLSGERRAKRKFHRCCRTGRIRNPLTINNVLEVQDEDGEKPSPRWRCRLAGGRWGSGGRSSR